MGKRFNFISESKGSKLLFALNDDQAPVVVKYKDGRSHKTKEYNLEELIDVKGWKALGNKFPVQSIIEVTQVQEEEKTESKDTTGDLERLKSEIKEEVEKEENQLGLFEGKKKGEDHDQ